MFNKLFINYFMIDNEFNARKELLPTGPILAYYKNTEFHLKYSGMLVVAIIIV